MNYMLGFILALVISLIATPWVRTLAFKIGAIDRPGEARKIHQHPVARLGGVAIFIAFFITIAVTLPVSRPMVALVLAAATLMVLGVVEDVRGLSPGVRLLWQVVAAGIALSGGIGIVQLTNPLGGVIDLTAGRFPVEIGPVRFHITPIANALSILWMVGLINAINFLDGLDGLACGVSSIAALVMFLLAVRPEVNQPQAALIALVLAGACLGFLPYNFFPARIFMGDSGSYLLGLTLAMVAMYSGGKLATASLVLGFTIIDGIWAVIRRLYHRTSPFSADRGHLHHLLLDAGLSQRKAVLLLYVLSLAFGVAALMSGSFEKLIGLVLLLIVISVMISVLMAVGIRRSRLR